LSRPKPSRVTEPIEEEEEEEEEAVKHTASEFDCNHSVPKF